MRLLRFLFGGGWKETTDGDESGFEPANRRRLLSLAQEKDLEGQEFNMSEDTRWSQDTDGWGNTFTTDPDGGRHY